MSFTLANVVRQHSASRPDAIAFVCGNRQLTWSALDGRSSRAAMALRDAGVGAGDRVAILAKNTPEYFEIACGCSKLDACIVGLNWRLKPREMAGILHDARPKILVTDAEHAELASEAARGRNMTLVTLGEDYEQRLNAALDDDPDVPSSPDSPMLILYSSGTTGRPKGIVLTNHNLSFTHRMATDLFRMKPDSVHMVASPLFHIGGFGTGMTLMTLGGRTVLMREADAPAILETIERERVTHAFYVPAVIQKLAELQESAGYDISSLELISYGAAPMTESLLRRSISVLGCGFLGCYGMTETAGTVTALFPEEHDSEGPRTHLLRSVGRPLPWAEVRVTDQDTGREADPGEFGEIWVRSEANMQGYLNQPETTAETLLEDGWLRTGDGAYRDEDGYFYLQDRIKDMIISGGENVYPIEVENVLSEHPAVSETAVIGVPDEKWGETVKAVVVLRASHALSAAELMRFTRSQLAHYKCPKSIDFVDELPRTATGKIQKKTLRECYGGSNSR